MKSDQENVIITFGFTCYNQKKEIIEALESIALMDKPYLYEIIVGDDGSSDGSPDAIKTFASEHMLNVKVLEPNGVPSTGVARRIIKNKFKRRT